MKTTITNKLILILSLSFFLSACGRQNSFFGGGSAIVQESQIVERECLGDSDGDGIIKVIPDFLDLMTDYGRPSETFDFNKDGIVNNLDLNFLLGHLGAECSSAIYPTCHEVDSNGDGVITEIDLESEKDVDQNGIFNAEDSRLIETYLGQTCS